MYVLIALSRWFCIVNPELAFTSPLLNYLGIIISDYKTIPSFTCALLVFSYFQKIDIGSVKWINFIAKSAFAVYVFHQTPNFYPHLWEDVFVATSWHHSTLFPVITIGVCITIYLIALTIDIIRLKYFEPLLVKTPIYIKLEKLLNKL